MKCVLSISGQHEVSHVMNTKATSDSLRTERIKKSTLHYSLNDPSQLAVMMIEVSRISISD